MVNKNYTVVIKTDVEVNIDLNIEITITTGVIKIRYTA